QHAYLIQVVVAAAAAVANLDVAVAVVLREQRLDVRPRLIVALTVVPVVRTSGSRGARGHDAERERERPTDTLPRAWRARACGHGSSRERMTLLPLSEISRRPAFHSNPKGSLSSAS